MLGCILKPLFLVVEAIWKQSTRIRSPFNGIPNGISNKSKQNQGGIPTRIFPWGLSDRTLSKRIVRFDKSLSKRMVPPDRVLSRARSPTVSEGTLSKEFALRQGLGRPCRRHLRSDRVRRPPVEAHAFDRTLSEACLPSDRVLSEAALRFDRTLSKAPKV